MASARKNYARNKPAHAALPRSRAFEMGCFMADLLTNEIQAESLDVVNDGQGRFPRVEYDDPDGSARPGRGGRPRENPSPRPGEK